MGLIKDTIDFLKDPTNLNLLILILPPLTFYLNGLTGWFIFSIMISAILFVYRLDLLNKQKDIINNRIKSLRKKKIPVKKFKGQIKKAHLEFKDYLLSWPFFGLVSIMFIVQFFYSTKISYKYSILLFGIHLGLIAFIIILNLVLHKNFKRLARRRKRR